MLKSMVKYLKDDPEIQDLLPEICMLKSLATKTVSKAKLVVACISEIQEQTLVSQLSFLAVDNCEEITGNVT